MGVKNCKLFISFAEDYLNIRIIFTFWKWAKLNINNHYSKFIIWIIQIIQIFVATLITFCLTFWLPECPSKDKTTVNREDQEVANNIHNWGECSQVCKQKDSCNHWTWYSDGAVYQCITMSNYGSTKTNKNAVSGDRDCVGIIIHFLLAVKASQ